MTGLHLSHPAAGAPPKDVLRMAVFLAMLFMLGCGQAGDGLVEPPESVDEPVLPAMTGEGLAEFDRLVPALLERHGIPGAAVGVMVDEELVMARGFGISHDEIAIYPDTRFRIASLSKPITSIAIHLLDEQSGSRLSMEDRAYEILSDLQGFPGHRVSTELKRITIGQLLYHFGGWDRDVAFDPMFRSVEAARVMIAPSPGDAETIIRYMLYEPLQFEPGSGYAYSNFGYAVLGRIIERLSGESYEVFVRNHLLIPAGAHEMRIGRSLVSTEDETRYHDHDGAPLATNVFDTSTQVRRPYGGFHLEAMDSHGGWTSSAVDLLRVLSVVDGGSKRPDLLGSKTRQEMLKHPGKHWGESYYYSRGWERSGSTYFHTGALPGSSSYMGCQDGVCVVALFNSWPQGDAEYFDDVTSVLWAAVTATLAWPAVDLFDRY